MVPVAIECAMAGRVDMTPWTHPQAVFDCTCRFATCKVWRHVNVLMESKRPCTAEQAPRQAEGAATTGAPPTTVGLLAGTSRFGELDFSHRISHDVPMRWSWTGVLAAFAVCASTVALAQVAPGWEWPVGSTTRRFVPPGTYNWRAAAAHDLTASIWYPSANGTTMTEHGIGPTNAPLFRLGRWSDSSPPSPGRFPLLVLSHGTGGSAQIMAWLARGLASRGYIVAAVNHPGNTALADYTAEGFLLWWERARDLSVTIDMLTSDKAFGPLIDQRRIGAVGFSLGGYTVVEIAGGRTDPRLFQTFCRLQGCADPPEFPGLFARWTELEKGSQDFRTAVAAAGRSLRDQRVRSVFAIAPALGPAFVTSSLQGISIPVAIVAGADDEIVPVGPNAQAVARVIPNATLTLLPGGVGHYTFLATCTDAGWRAQPQLCADAVGVNRDAIHRETIDAAAQFFETNLR